MQAKLNQVLTQLTQWPPTTSTVIGIGLLLFGIDYAIYGNFYWALGVAGAFKVICPEDAPAVSVVEQATTKGT